MKKLAIGVIVLVTLVALTPVAWTLYQTSAFTNVTGVTIDRVTSAQQGEKLIIQADITGSGAGPM